MLKNKISRFFIAIIIFKIIMIFQQKYFMEHVEIDSINLETEGRILEKETDYHPIIGRVVGDLERPSYRLWESDGPSNNCYQYQTRFAKDLPRVLLVSFPGSGNTWLRYLLEASTGIFTGSIYTDKSLTDKGFLGEKESPGSGRTLTQKTHGLSVGHMDADPAVRRNSISPSMPRVLLLRNPADALKAFWNFKNAKVDSHTGRAELSVFNTNEFHKFVSDKLPKWEQLAIDHLLRSEAPVHIVYYENLKLNLLHELELLLEFLGIPVDNERMKCIDSHQDGSFKRGPQKPFDPFTDKEKKSLDAAVSVVLRLITDLGHRKPPLYQNNSKIN